MVHLESTCGWDGKVMGRRWGPGEEPSYPTRSLPIPELPPRHRAVALPSQPYPASTQMDVGKSVPWPAKAGPVERGGQSAKARSPASFCKWHGGSVVRLRAVGEAKDVIVHLPPFRPT